MIYIIYHIDLSHGYNTTQRTYHRTHNWTHLVACFDHAGRYIVVVAPLRFDIIIIIMNMINYC
jgi:hypothetical protein